LCSAVDANASRYEKIWRAVRRIPAGRVATYGQIAELAGFDGHARQVGYALHHLPEASDVPWHRVINASGEVSARSSGDSHELQRMLLEGEGVTFDTKGRVDLERFRWKSPRPRISRVVDR
jgi:methylated-DNA-protein-cysteine methyltransferase-like protein